MMPIRTTSESSRLNKRASSLLLWACSLGLTLLLAIGVWGTAVHVGQVLGHSYPLDYGEGPLISQTRELLRGRSLAQLYRDPGDPPYLVINYPPVVLLLSRTVAEFLQATQVALPELLAGRVVALLSTVLAAIALLTLVLRATQAAQKRWLALLAPLMFLSLSLVREWMVLFRVDMTALALSLWGLALTLRAPERRSAAAGAGLLFALSLLAKPSFVAAPASAGLWLLIVAPRRSLLLSLTAAAIGGLVTVAMQVASNGWFLFHVVEANVNRFDGRLAWPFWREHIKLHWPLMLAAGLAAAGLLSSTRRAEGPRATRWRCWLPVFYAIAGAISAVGVGKVGAYSNYFLDLDAALVWLACSGLQRLAAAPLRPLTRASWLLAPALLALLLVQAARYYPLWDETRPRSAAKDPRTPRIIVGRHAIWDDLAREREILQGQRRVKQRLSREVLAAGPQPVLSDIPGVVVAAGGVSRLQVFEMRQLLDQGLWQQDQLLRELANGSIKLVVLEWLGNWLSPEMVTLIRHRYAPDGSLAQLSLYRPVAIGPYTPHPASVPDGPALEGYHLLPPLDNTYRPAEQLAVTLRLRRGQLRAADGWGLSIKLFGSDGSHIGGTSSQLLYGALPATAWPMNDALHQVVRLTLPQVEPGTYRLVLELSQAGTRALREELTTIRVGPPRGRVFSETGHYVSAPFLNAWLDAGGHDAAGLPLTPAIPFEWGWLQCFERACLERRAGSAQIEPQPLGELLSLEWPRAADATLTGPFRRYWEAHNRKWNLGEPLTGELRMGDKIVQYLRYARLERAPDATAAEAIELGRLGAEYMRLNEWDRFSLP